MRYSEIWPRYAKYWDSMKIKPAQLAEFQREAKYAVANKAQYQQVEVATGVPWAMIAVIHRREGSADFGTYLGNGQSLKRKTTIVPEGRGPFPNFLAGAIDACKVDGLTSVKDWRLEKQLFYCATFNGWGYELNGLPSPYVWGGTNIQKRGKFIRDHVLDRKVWDTQPGCAPLLWCIAQLDPGITFTRET